jgi:hypothetical protein
MLHSDYIQHLEKHFDAKLNDDEFCKMRRAYEKTIGIMVNLNLDATLAILKKLFAPVVCNKPRDPVCMLRSLILMTVLKVTGITFWVDQLRYVSLFAILSGFEPDDVPGIGNFYDFMKRIVDGPYPKPDHNTVKRSQINARKHLRNLKREKGSSKNDFNTNCRRSEKLVDKLLNNSDLPRVDDLNKTLEDLLFQSGIIPSVESGLLQSLDKPVISGDGSILETAASSYGKSTYSCRKEGVFQCDHPRSFTSPTEQWCYSQHLNRFVFGDRYYHLVANENEHDFPLLTMMPGGNESDHTLSLK